MLRAKSLKKRVLFNENTKYREGKERKREETSLAELLWGSAQTTTNKLYKHPSDSEP